MARKPQPVRSGVVRAHPMRERGKRGPRDGRWYWRARTSVDGKVAQVGTRWATATEALEWVRELDRQGAGELAMQRHEAAEDRRRGGGPAGSVTVATVEDLLAYYIGWYKNRPDVRPRSVEFQRRCRVHLRRLLGHYALRRVTLRELSTYTNTRLAERNPRRPGKGYAPYTVSQELGTLKAAWTWARKSGLIVEPVPELPALNRAPVADTHTPTPEEIVRLLEALPDDGYSRDFAMVLWSTGARPGEAAALTPSHYDRDRRQVLLDGKTGPRRVPVSPPLAEILDRRCEGLESDDRIWPRSFRHMRSGWSSKVLAVACEAAEVPKVTPRGFRRAVVDRLCRSGVRVEVAAEVMGHSVAVMLDVYRRINDDDRREAVTRAALGALPGKVVDLEAARRRWEEG